MSGIDYVAERAKLLEELRHHHATPSYVGLDGADTDHARWRVGCEKTDGSPDRWAGLPVVYVEAPEVPRGGTRDWLRRENPLARHDPPGS
jgi:hypothetical protein